MDADHHEPVQTVRLDMPFDDVVKLVLKVVFAILLVGLLLLSISAAAWFVLDLFNAQPNWDFGTGQKF